MATRSVTFDAGDHRETHLLRSRGTREWLSRRFFEAEGAVPSGHALRDAIETLSGVARFDGACRPVHVRLAGHDDDIFLDLGDASWQVVHVTADDWRIVPAADCMGAVRFRRTAGLLALPVPARGGDVHDLRARS